MPIAIRPMQAADARRFVEIHHAKRLAVEFGDQLAQLLPSAASRTHSVFRDRRRAPALNAALVTHDA